LRSIASFEHAFDCCFRSLSKEGTAKTKEHQESIAHFMFNLKANGVRRPSCSGLFYLISKSKQDLLKVFLRFATVLFPQESSQQRTRGNRRYNANAAQEGFRQPCASHRPAVLEKGSIFQKNRMPHASGCRRHNRWRRHLQTGWATLLQYRVVVL